MKYRDGYHGPGAQAAVSGVGSNGRPLPVQHEKMQASLNRLKDRLGIPRGDIRDRKFTMIKRIEAGEIQPDCAKRFMADPHNRKWIRAYRESQNGALGETRPTTEETR